MRRIKLLFISLAVLLLAASCSNVDDKTEGKIPSDALVVVKADMPQIIKHSGVQIKDGRIEFPTKFKKMLKDMGDSHDVNKKLNKLMDSGIDFKHSCYVFVPNGAMNGDSDFDAVLLVPVDDVNKLKDYIEDVSDVVLEKNGEMMMGRDENGNLFLIKDGTLCYTSTWKEDVEEDFIELLSPESAISANAAISKALDTSDDINVFMDTKKIRKETIKQIGNDRDPEAMAVSSAMDIFDVESTAYHISLADNECNVKCVNELAENSDYPKLVKKMTSEPNADLISMMPSGEHTLIYSMSINGEAIVNFNLVKNLLGDLLDDPDFADFVSLFKSIKGPVVFGVASNDLKEQKFNIVAATKTPKANKLHSIIGMTPLSEEAVRRGDEYVLNESPSVLIGEDNDVLYFKFLGGSTKATTNQSEVKSLFSEAVAALYCTSTVDDMKMQLTAQSKDLKDGTAKMFVMENGKKLCILDALTFFYKLGNEFNSYSYSDYDYDYESEYDYDEDTAVVAEEVVEEAAPAY